MSRDLGAPLEVASKWGSSFLVHLEDDVFQPLVLDRECEPTTSEIAGLLLRAGDHVLDVGANFGWYTALFGRLVGTSGRVVSIEPNPRSFTRLTDSVARNRLDNVRCVPLAVANAEGTAKIHQFTGLGSGHASLRPLGRTDYVTVEVATTTLDHIAEQHALRDVALVKVDTEGAEVGVLEGAKSMLHASQPPSWILEVNRDALASFGSSAQHLMNLLPRDYEMFIIDEKKRRLVRAASREIPGDFNVIAAARDDHKARLRSRSARAV